MNINKLYKKCFANKTSLKFKFEEIKSYFPQNNVQVIFLHGTFFLKVMLKTNLIINYTMLIC